VTCLVSFTPAAERDRDHHAAYIAEDNPAAARRFYEALAASVAKLGEFPAMGSPRAYGSAELACLRMMPVQGFPCHLIFYRPAEGGVEIVRVLHSSRDIGSLFEEE
jgi:toxin ParE1/3/4